MFISIGIDEDGRPYITTSDGSREKVVRKGKGKSVIDFPSTYTVLDIETTGLDPRYCEIIEISAMKYSSGQNIGTFSTLVKPSEPIDEYITSLTGITNDMLKSAPDISETMQKFYNFVGSDLIVGYNVNFDINFLYDNLLNCRSLILSNSFIDVMRIARKILPGLKNHKHIRTERTSIITRDGRKQNGSLLYTILPIQFSIDQFYQRQMDAVDRAKERQRVARRMEQTSV